MRSWSIRRGRRGARHSCRSAYRRNSARIFLLVHLVRDPRAVAWSTLRTKRDQNWTRGGRPKRARKHLRQSSSGTRSLVTIAGWTVANLACEMFGFFHPDRYLRVRYEDLVRTPVKVLGRIFARVALDPPTTLEPTATRTNRHQLYGNAMRFLVAGRAQRGPGRRQCR